MHVPRVVRALFLGVFLIGAIGAVLSPVHAQAKLVKIDGSSTVYPATEAVAEEFQKAQKGAVNVTVGISGTGSGFKKCCRGEADISDASRPILQEEMELCKQKASRTSSFPSASTP